MTPDVAILLKIDKRKKKKKAEWWMFWVLLFSLQESSDAIPPFGPQGLDIENEAKTA